LILVSHGKLKPIDLFLLYDIPQFHLFAAVEHQLVYIIDWMHHLIGAKIAEIQLVEYFR
jgi:hypothetical protein